MFLRHTTKEQIETTLKTRKHSISKAAEKLNSIIEQENLASKRYDITS